MNEVKTPIGPQASDEMVGYEFNVLEFLVILARHKRKIIGLPLACAVIAIAISFMVPNTYRAGTKMLPPQQAQSGASAVLAQLGGVAGAMAGGAGLKSPNELYIGMLRSRTIADKIVARFDLKKVYELDSLEKTRSELAENTFISSAKDGMITIEVEDHDQKRVALVANGYVDELLKLTRVLAVTEAAQRRLFFERQLEIAKDNLATAEITLKRALDTRGVISVDSESRAILETVGRLRAQVSAKEIQLSSMRAFITASNPDFQRAEQDLNSLRAELSKLENGRPEVAGAAAPGAKSPVGLENIKILRDVKYYEMLYQLLAKQYEMARLDEAKDSSIIQVLDPAVEPERKYKPRRLIILLLALFAGVLVAIGWAVLAEFKARAMHSPESATRWNELRSLLRGK